MNDFFYDSAVRVFSFVCLGAVLGAIYDVFRVLRISRKGGNSPSGRIYEKLKPKKKLFSGKAVPKWLKLTDNALTFIEDILFWLIVFVTEAVYIYYINDGEIRIDFFVLSLAGFMLYGISLGKIVIFLSGRIIFFVRCLLLRLAYIIIYPVRIVCGFISAAFEKTVNIIAGAIADTRRRAYSKREKKRLLDLSARGFEEK